MDRPQGEKIPTSLGVLGSSNPYIIALLRTTKFSKLTDACNLPILVFNVICPSTCMSLTEVHHLCKSQYRKSCSRLSLYHLQRTQWTIRLSRASAHSLVPQLTNYAFPDLEG